MNDRVVPGCALAAMLPLLAASMATPAHADVVFAVDSIADQVDDDTSDGLCHTSANTCSLRAAIMQANRASGAGATITVPAGRYVLARPPANGNGDDTGDLNLTTPTSGNPPIHLVGAGAAETIIDANQIDRVLFVHASRTATISGLTLKNGFQSGPIEPGGGGVFNAGVLSIAHCVIENNVTEEGGGGIYNTAELGILASTIRTNIAFVGGGLFVKGPTTIRDSTVHDNGANFGGGAEISAFGTDPQLVATNTTFSQNYANSSGGGIDNGGTTFLYNCSVVGNDADHDRDELGGIGGGLYATGNSLFIVVNTLIANNTVFSSPIADNCKAVIDSFGLNLLDEREGCTTTTSESTLGFVSLDTIGLLQDNGGPTLTHALLAGSEAIDSTLDSLGCVNEFGSQLATDQRGAARVAGARCDVGAFEYGSTVPVDDLVFRDGFEGGM